MRKRRSVPKEEVAPAQADLERASGLSSSGATRVSEAVSAVHSSSSEILTGTRDASDETRIPSVTLPMREHSSLSELMAAGHLDASTTAEEEEEDEDDIDAVDPRVKQARKTGVSAFATADGFDEELSDARSGSRDELSQGGSREAVLPSQNGGGDLAEVRVDVRSN